MASVNHETRIPAVNDTWAKRCDDHYFFTDGPMPRGYKHFVTHRALTDRDSAWKKLRIVIPFIIRNISADFEWYIRTSDDAFYIIENLRYFLKDFDPDVKHYFGFHMKPNLPRGYVSGSAIVFSRAMMRFLTDTIIPDKIRCPEDQSSIPEYRFDDVAIASCLAAYELYPEEARDSGFRELFHPFNHSEMYRGENYHGLVLHSKHPVKNGFDAFSPVLISSHYLTPHEMRLYETLLYQVNVMTQFSRGNRLE